MSKFKSERYYENTIEWKLEKREKEARERGLCVHCYGVGRQHKSGEGLFGDLTKWEPCKECRATGRNLNLEARSYEFHRERISKLSFSQVLREYIQLAKKRYSIDGYQPFTTDEDRWHTELRYQLRDRFKIGTSGFSINQRFPYLPFFDDVLFKWERRFSRKDKELFRYVWEKVPPETPKPDKAAEREKNVKAYRDKAFYRRNESRKWKKRYKILFPEK